MTIIAEKAWLDEQTVVASIISSCIETLWIGALLPVGDTRNLRRLRGNLGRARAARSRRDLNNIV